MAKICTRCGGELLDNDIYCGKCGQQVEGMTPPANSWNVVAANLGPKPKKKGVGCLSVILVFLVVVAILIAALYFLFLRKGKSAEKPGGSKAPTPAATESAGSGISISLDDLLKPAQSKEPAPTAAPAPTPAVESTPEAATEPTPAPTPEPSPEPTVEATPEPTQQVNTTNPFNDVFESDYYYTPVMWALEKGLTGRTSAFLPHDACTRAQAVTMMWRAAGSPQAKNPTLIYTDVAVWDYFYQATLWANEVGITTAIPGGQFYPDMAITRGQMVTFLYRLAGEEVNRENPYTDVAVWDYCYQPALWALEKGVSSGTTPTTFSPDAVCDRGNAVTFMYRALAEKY